MNRLDFAKSIELPMTDGFLKDKFPELTAIYNLIDPDKFKVKGNLSDNNRISFTIYCNKDEAISISNRVQNHIMNLYNKNISVSYTIHKDGIDLYLIADRG